MLAVGFTGVVGDDDVRMRQPGGGFDLAMKCRTDSGDVIAVDGRTFNADDALHALMPGLEDLPHAAGADLVEHSILVENKAPDVAFAGDLGLERRKLATLDQHTC